MGAWMGMHHPTNVHTDDVSQTCLSTYTTWHIILPKLYYTRTCIFRHFISTTYAPSYTCHLPACHTTFLLLAIPHFVPILQHASIYAHAQPPFALFLIFPQPLLELNISVEPESML